MFIVQTGETWRSRPYLYAKPGILKNEAEIAEILLRHGANVNARDNAGWTALMGASKEGRSEVAEVLLKYGADTNIQNDSRSTALIEAVSGGRTKVAEILLEGYSERVVHEYALRALNHVYAAVGMRHKA